MDRKHNTHMRRQIQNNSLLRGEIDPPAMLIHGHNQSDAAAFMLRQQRPPNQRIQNGFHHPPDFRRLSLPL